MEWLENLFKDPAKAAATAAGLAGLYGVINPSSKVGEFLGMGSRQQPVGYTGGIPEYGITRALQPNAFDTTTITGAARRPGSAGRRYFTDTTYTPTGKTMSAAAGPVNTTVAPPPAPDQTAIARQVAQDIRQNKYTPATAASQLNAKYGGNMNEESVVFELLNRGFTTPREVSEYYKNRFGRDYAVGDILSRYQAMGGTKTFAQGGLASLAQSRGYYLGGPTDGMADEIPATINGEQPAALSDGEFVIPADVVSHLGNGNSDAGARALYAMMDRVRQARTGRKEQGRKINPNKFIPV